MSGQQSAAAHRRVQRLGRVGYLTYGLVQLVVAWLALQLAWGTAPDEASTAGALQTMARQPIGGVLLWVLAAGLAVLAVWQLLMAVTRNQGAWATTSAAAAGTAYAALAVIAGRFALRGSGAEGSGDSGEKAAATLFDLPAGQWVVAIIGVGIAALGVRHVVKGVRSGFVDDLEPRATRGTRGTAIVWLGRLGYSARGTSYVVVGALFVTAALTRDPDDAGGLDEALLTLKQQPGGQVVLTGVALGFAAYGLFCFARARYETE